MNNLYKTEDTRYENIRKATIDDVGQELFDKYYRNTGKRWLDIARVWDKVYTCKKHFVLISVVHKIMWGVHPYESSDPKFRYLLQLIEEEVLRDGEASQMWNKWRTFKNVLTYVTEATVSAGKSGLSSHFITHYYYLRNRTLNEIKYSKDSCFEVAVGIDDCAVYEDAVELLVPTSKSWTRQQWGDDLVLAEEVEKLYGVDFTASWESRNQFDRLVNLICAWRGYRSSVDVYWYATNITDLPESIVRRIWPDNTDNVLADILMRAYKVLNDYEDAGEPFSNRKDSWIDPLYHYERSAFKNSWVFKYVRDRYYQGVYSGKVGTQLRNIVFDIEMTAA